MDDHQQSREEQQILNSVGDTHGEEWAEENADLILDRPISWANSERETDESGGKG